ncbi:MAG: hypothetical protein ABJM58_01535 [Alteripontixanthobacter sp.]
MIGKVIGAALGSKVAKNTRGIGGTTGAALGAFAPAVLARLSIPTMLAVAAGGYAYKKYQDKQTAKAKTPPKVASSAT